MRNIVKAIIIVLIFLCSQQFAQVQSQVVQDKYTLIDNIKIHYKVAGPSYAKASDGKPLILIHGAGASADFWPDNIPELAKEYKVYAIDLPGFGKSDKPQVNYTRDFFADSVRKFMDSQGIDRAILIGHSLGGSIALEFALRFPPRLSGMVLADSGGLPHKWVLLLRLARLPIIGEAMASFLNKKMIKNVVLKAFYNKKIVTDELVDGVYAYLKTKEAKRAFLSVLRTDKNYKNKLSLIKAPTLIIWGDKDEQVPIENAYVFHQLIAGSKLHIIKDAGHTPQMEKAEEFNRIVLEFLRKF